MGTLIGANASAVTFTTATNTTPVLGGGKGFTVGTRWENYDGKEYVFVQANSAIGQYAVVSVPADGSFVAVGFTTTVAAAGPQQLGIAPFALASGDYGWVQIYGRTRVKVLGSCVKNIALFSTATAGSLDDATASNYRIEGLNLLSTNPSATATAMDGFIIYPHVLQRAGPA